MLFDRLFLETPPPLLAAIIIILLVGLMLLGSILRRQRERNRKEETGDDGYEGQVVSPALGLLALLLGFTFALAIDRYDARRSLVLAEANAIGTTYLRAQLLDEPHRSRISRLLEGYTQNRLDLANATEMEDKARLMAQSNAYQSRLWRETVSAIRPIRGLEIASTFVDTMNQTIDMAAARFAARRAHVPSRVMVALLLYMSVCAFMLGFAMATARRRASTAVLLGLLVLAFLLILDIDRPTSGAIREPQSAMEDLLAMIRANPPNSFGEMIQGPPPERP